MTERLPTEQLADAGRAAGLTAALGGRYVVEREIGRGGMATVYLARDVRHKRPVALKVLDPELSQSLGVERFLREIELAARLTHPHILPVHDSGEAAGIIYYVMPFVEGESLRHRMDRDGPLDVDVALGIGGEIADALAYAHQQGVIHRDVKPENVLLFQGHATLADFGVARAIARSGGEHLTQTGLIVGTPAYMSPEQAVGDGEMMVRAISTVSPACCTRCSQANRPLPLQVWRRRSRGASHRPRRRCGNAAPTWASCSPASFSAPWRPMSPTDIRMRARSRKRFEPREAPV